MARKYEGVWRRSALLVALESQPEAAPLPPGATGAALVDAADTAVDADSGYRMAKVRRLESVDDRLEVAWDGARGAVTLCNRMSATRPVIERSAIDAAGVPRRRAP